MAPFKIEHFGREMGGAAFPPHRPIGQPERAQVYESLRRALGLAEGSSESEIIQSAWNKAQVIEGANAEVEGFDLASVAAAAHLDLQVRVFVDSVNWSDMDEFSFGDLCKYFEWIWYPGPDDMLVVAKELQWLLFIRHYGEVRVITRLCSSPSSLRGGE